MESDIVAVSSVNQNVLLNILSSVIETSLIELIEALNDTRSATVVASPLAPSSIVMKTLNEIESDRVAVSSVSSRIILVTKSSIVTESAIDLVILNEIASLIVAES